MSREHRAHSVEKRQARFRRRYRVVHTDSEGKKYGHGEFWTLAGANRWIAARTWSPVTAPQEAR